MTLTHLCDPRVKMVHVARVALCVRSSGRSELTRQVRDKSVAEPS